MELEKTERPLLVTELAEIMRVSPATIHRMCKAGTIQATRIGTGEQRSQWRIPGSEVRRLLGETRTDAKDKKL